MSKMQKLTARIGVIAAGAVVVFAIFLGLLGNGRL